MTPNNTISWHTEALEAVRKRLGTDLAQGLSAAEVQARLQQYGPNSLTEATSKSPWRMLLEQFSDFMILVLLASGVIAAFLGEPEDTIAIFAIVILNAIIGFVQEYRAEQAMSALRKMAAPQANVLRGGQTLTVEAADLVPGDIVLLEAGNAVPADLRVAESAQLRVEEAALTGESQPVDKITTAIDDTEAPLGDRINLAFKGTIVTFGRGRGLVVGTGMQTELGKIAALLDQPEATQTPLQLRLAQFGRYLAMAALGICAIVFAVGVQRGEPVVRMFLTAVSLAVAAIPEALPAVVTITLALGARRMLHAKALVRHLPAVETLGSVTFICTDKTGTLTQNRMQVNAYWVDGESSEAWPQQTNARWELLAQALALSNDSQPDAGGGFRGDPTEVALVEGAAKAGVHKQEQEQRWPRVGELPFSAERRRMTTAHAGAQDIVAFTKGAPESVLAQCKAGDVEKAQRASAELAARGLRVLAFAQRRWPQGTTEFHEDQLELIGLIGLMDPPRPEAREAVGICHQAGIVPVMITGDHAVTAQAIARDLGIISDQQDQVLQGTDLAGLDLDALKERVQHVRVYARVDPHQKLRIVEALQKRGEFVAMTGDGVNDAPALRRADIGIAMGKMGTDVAREASDLVLLDDNFATIIGAAAEGRHIFDNIRKFVKFVLASNAAEIWTIFLAPFLGLPVPLLPIHILWTNLVTDGLPGLALAAEPADRDVMQRPPRPPTESLFAHGLWQHVLWVGALIAAVSLFAQWWAIHNGSPRWRTIVFSVLTLSQMAHVLAVRSERESTLKLGLFSNLPLAGAVLLTGGLQALVVFWPPMQRIFGTGAMTWQEFAMVTGLCSTVFVAVEIEKAMVRRGWLYATKR